MEVREIKNLLNLMNQYGLTEIEIEDKKGKIRLVRGGAAGAESDSNSAAAPRASSAPTRRPVAALAPDAAPAESAIQLAANQRLVESPMVGTFYRASAPDAAPFVEEGSSVRKGQPLCIIEAMKMMNEIEAPTAGRVVRILAENAQKVEYGQPLMILEVG